MREFGCLHLCGFANPYYFPKKPASPSQAIQKEPSFDSWRERSLTTTARQATRRQNLKLPDPFAPSFQFAPTANSMAAKTQKPVSTSKPGITAYWGNDPLPAAPSTAKPFTAASKPRKGMAAEFAFADDAPLHAAVAAPSSAGHTTAQTTFEFETAAMPSGDVTTPLATRRFSNPAFDGALGLDATAPSGDFCKHALAYCWSHLPTECTSQGRFQRSKVHSCTCQPSV